MADKLSRRDFMKKAGLTIAGASLAGIGGLVGGCGAKQAVGAKASAADAPASGKAKVYFTKHIDADHLVKLYQKVNADIQSKIAVKLHTGEPHGPNILPRELVRDFMAQIPGATIVEANVAYGGARATTEKHRDTLAVNGWDFCPVDIIDEAGDVNFPVKNGIHLKEVAMGAHLANYDSLVVLTHFKGHAMGGFGGSLKNIAIGCASGQHGKRQVHGYLEGPMPFGPDELAKMPVKEELMERMADSGKATCDFFGKHIVFLNVLRRMSVDCDCAGTRAAEPTIPDIGMLASTDILAIDQASCDLVWSSKQNADLVERIQSRHGLHQLEAMRKLKMGNPQYELISID